ncbi:hypothetical protein PZE06_04820 [Robertmurraya sp. DFI.2.37]|uniref:hypothetical protein n=1 Tax=Robertmurraya sp. DFI.2.37 TaxID=3031819 RepID=UPI001CDA4AE9|nr:hypothetical protein [Robertmurraya sp. DFI.2.37]MDF1507505.1 hypothetical protein [Robertmurraya sp. DFI.2.37]
MNIIEKLLKNPLNTTFDIEPFIHGSIKNKLPELELAIDGLITPEQAVIKHLLVQCATAVSKVACIPKFETAI